MTIAGEAVHPSIRPDEQPVYQSVGIGVFTIFRNLSVT